MRTNDRTNVSLRMIIDENRINEFPCHCVCASVCVCVGEHAACIDIGVSVYFCTSVVHLKFDCDQTYVRLVMINCRRSMFIVVFAICLLESYSMAFAGVHTISNDHVAPFDSFV